MRVDGRGTGGYIAAAGSAPPFGTGTSWYRIADPRAP